MRTTRRRNRLRSAQYANERWKPSATFVVLAVGLIFGAAFGLRHRLSDQSNSVQQHYMLLVSDLYAQGVPLASVRDRLISLGYANPSVAVLAVADQLAQAQDSVSQQEADQLHQFAEALVAGPDSQATVQAQNQAVPTVEQSPTVPAASTPVPAMIDAPTSTVTPVPPSELLVTASPEPNSAPAPAASPTPRPPTPTPVPKATAAPEKSGVVHTAGHQPALLRAAPTSKSTAVAIVPDEAKVAVYGIARGEALEPPENRWYHVVYNGRQGYLYYKLIQVGG
jgi:hypothetical protein